MSEFPGDRKNFTDDDGPPDYHYSEEEEEDHCSKRRGEEDGCNSPEPSSSSSSCSSRDPEEYFKEKSSAVKSFRVVDVDVGDDGYHTPTSPSSRIPTPTVCPPAPKKPKMRLRAKRKREVASAGECGGSSTCLLPFFNSDLDDLRPKLIKKAIEDTSARSV